MNIQYMKALLQELAFPNDAQEYFFNSAVKINQFAEREIDDALWCFKAAEYSFDGMEKRYLHISELSGVNHYTVATIFCLLACEDLEKRYAEAGYPRELFIDTMKDLRYKALECKAVKGVYGTFVASWNVGFFNLTRFALGRFQYERKTFNADIFGVDGNYIKKGDTVLNIHIPSSGIPLTDEVRYDSYRRALNFFYPGCDTPQAFVCNSWLLYPEYEEYIPNKLNIKRFRKDFAIVGSTSRETFSDGWRVFADKADLPPSELPQMNTMQKTFALYCMTGKNHGSGYGVFFFDGEKIIK